MLTTASINIEANSRELWTPKEAERQLNGFKFIKPGWYLTKTDSILVVPCCFNLTHYWFWIYHKRNPIQYFREIADASVQVDER
jgi:hypothetical protein